MLSLDFSYFPTNCIHENLAAFPFFIPLQKHRRLHFRVPAANVQA